MNESKSDSDLVGRRASEAYASGTMRKVSSHSYFQPTSQEPEKPRGVGVRLSPLYRILDLPPLLLTRQSLFTKCIAKLTDFDALVTQASDYTVGEVLEEYVRAVPGKNLIIPSIAVAKFHVFLNGLGMSSTGIWLIHEEMKKNPQLTELELFDIIKILVAARQKSSCFSAIFRSSDVTKFYINVMNASSLDDLLLTYRGQDQMPVNDIFF